MKKPYRIKIVDGQTVLLSIGMILIIVALIWIIVSNSIVDYFKIKSLGELGDFINGISSPIIGMVGAILVYKSFIVQFEANRKQVENYEADRAFRDLWDLYKDLKSDFDSFEYIPMFQNDKGLTYTGVHGIQRYLKDLEAQDKRCIESRGFFVIKISYFLQNYLFTLNRVIKSAIDEDEKQVFINKMEPFFDIRFQDYLTSIIKIHRKNNYDDLFLNNLEDVKNRLLESRNNKYT